MALESKMTQAEVASADDRSLSLNADDNHIGQVFNYIRHVFSDGSLFFGIIVAAAWMFSRPFRGIQGDARIYMTRALADLDPHGVGQDMMFVHDGQSQFSIFTPLSDWLVASINPANTAFLLAVINMIAWILSAAFLVGRFTQGRTKWAILIMIAVIPSFYGPLNLHFGEIIAIPRPLAEACVLAALGFMLDERRITAFCFLVLAAAFHPIMALPGLGVFALDLCRTNRLWIALYAAGAVACCVAVYMGLPLFNRLNVVIDPEWLALLRTRNWNLFPTEWPIEAFGFLTLQVATIYLAANLFAPRVRFIFLCSAALGIAGILIAAVFADLLPVLLVAQAQVWRTAWLTSVMAAISLCAGLLAVRNTSQRVELAYIFITLGWLLFDQPILSFLVSFIAVFLNQAQNLTFSFNRKIINLFWGLILVVGITDKIPATIAFLNFWITTPSDAHTPFVVLWNIFLPSILLAAAAIIFVRWDHVVPRKAIGLLALALGAAAICVWDDRQPEQKITDRAYHAAELTSLFPADAGEIYSLDNFEPWYLLGRPTWTSEVQGASTVFARPLAIRWHERVKTLVGLNLIDANILTTRFSPLSREAIVLTRSKVDALCTRPDAPSAIVAPLEEGMAHPAGLKFKTWKPTAAEFRLTQQGAVATWHRIEKFMIISCADHAPDEQRAQAN